MNNEQHLCQRWQTFCKKLGQTSPYTPISENIISKWWQILNDEYSQSHRFYHNWDHIAMCLNELDKLIHSAWPPTCPILVELIIWFHDSVYNITDENFDNEKASADLAVAFIKDAKRDASEFNPPYSLIDNILATKHISWQRGMDNRNGAIVCAIDLAILAQPWDQYLDYAEKIRLEFKKVPIEIYRVKRIEFLKKLLAQRQYIFMPKDGANHPLNAKYEVPARKNILTEIKLLESGQFPYD